MTLMTSYFKYKYLLLSAILALSFTDKAFAAIPYGPMLVNGDQLTAYNPWSDPTEGLHPEYLLDGDYNTFWISNWHTDDSNIFGKEQDYHKGYHYLEIYKFRDANGNYSWDKGKATRGEAGDIIQITQLNRNNYESYYESYNCLDYCVFYRNPETWEWKEAGHIRLAYAPAVSSDVGRMSVSNTLKMPAAYDALRLVSTLKQPNEDPKVASRFQLAELRINKVKEEVAEPRVIPEYGLGAVVPDLQNTTRLKGTNGHPFGINYDFVHTKGFVDEHNHQNNDNQKAWYTDWNIVNSTNKWNNQDVLDANNIEIIDVSWLNVNGTNRQRAHTVEHTVYAMPGVPLILAPYSDFNDQSCYNLGLTRWYDWTTDKASPNVFFHYKPEDIFNLESGDYAGSVLKDKEQSYAATPIFWTDEANFEEKTIAMDASLNGLVSRTNNFKDDETKFYEPTVGIRHIFHVRNAREQAEKLSASVEANNKYIETTKRVVSARSGQFFQIRLDTPVPIADQKDKPSYNMFYLDVNGNVARGYRPVIEVNGVRGTASNSGIFYTSSAYAGYGKIHVDMDVPRVAYLGEWNCSFDRFLACDAGNAKEGTYRVRLLLTDKDGNVVNIRDTESPIVVAQYDVTFMNPKAAILEPEEVVRNNPQYEYTSTNYLQNSLKLGEPVAKVDFDEYRHLFDLTDYMHPTDAAKKKYMYKWPRPWGQSGYSFGFDARYDYNMYMLSSHSDNTPYHAACEYTQDNNNVYNSTINKKFGMDTDGLYDRRFYETEGKENGLFYYVNAASDPGQLATMQIDDLCSGATLFVSGWMAEGSGGETQNLIINFVAVKKDTGERITLHSFVTGYIVSVGVWNYFYYSFVPNLLNMGLQEKDIDHYELFVENNCKNSGGADYFFDDIRVYVAKPRVSAAQATPLCAGNDSPVVRVRTPYEVMLSANGLLKPETASDAQTVDFYYTFIDKKKYDDAVDIHKKTHEEAYNEAVIRYNYDGKADMTQTYGHAYFNTFLENNPVRGQDYIEVSEVVGRETIAGEDFLVFNTAPKDHNLIVGSEYYLALYTSKESGDVPGVNDFDIRGACAKACTLYITASGVVKIDGVPVPDMSNIVVCENQWPVVQVDIYSQTPSQDPAVTKPSSELLEKASAMDWYDGPVGEYNKVEYNGTLLCEALHRFRSVPEYRELSDPDQPAKGDFTEADRQTLIHFSTVIDDEKKQRRPPLHLHMSSYIFPYLTVPDGEPEMMVYCSAIPIDRFNVVMPAMVCTAVSEIRVIVRNKSPFLKHGIQSDDLVYPSVIDDVPLRISLKDLEKVSGDIENDNADYIANSSMLVVPIREAFAVTPEVVRLLLKGRDDYVYLVGTNDPAYHELGVPSDDPTGLRQIGRFRELTAIVKGDKTLNNARLQFRKGDDFFRFREGYYYRIRFDYQEDTPNASNSICDGRDVITLKVVPEYAMYTDAENTRNFNNDNNWRRVTAAELYGDASADADYVTDGNNANKFSYAPIHTTQAIIPPMNSPMILNDCDVKTVRAKDVVNKTDATYSWVTDTKGNAAKATTADIEYDMVAECHSSNDKAVICRPWRANTCEDIHFNSGAAIHNQTALSYGQASVDFEIAPNRWYTLASPLQAVYAGDMYLPTKGARQNTRLFTDINFKRELNNRFRPAVYQRSWNTGKAIVYELPGSGEDRRNVAIRSSWSHVYNDVQVAYNAGQGFSVKTDVSKATNTSEDMRVKFRLPKADKSYKYFSMDGNTVSPADYSVDRAGTGRLNGSSVNATLSGESAGKYFMTGNPFMAYLDLKAFLDANPNLERKIYVMNGDGTLDLLVDNAGNITSTGTLHNNGLIAPMQGFFVVSKNDVRSLPVTFSLATMTGTDPASASPSPLYAPSRAAEAILGLTVTASDGDKALSTALIRLDGAADASFRADEDMELFIDGLSDTPRVFTVAGNTAVTINTLADIDRVEVGLVNDDADRDVTLTFTGTDAAGPGLALYDAATGEVTPLTEGLSMKVRGSVASRLFIVSAAADTETVSTITVAVDGMEAVVNAAFTREELTVDVFDTMGRKVADASDASGIVRIPLDRGIYVVNARSGAQKLTSKIVVR